MTSIGRYVYASGAVMLGIIALAYGRFSPDWLPVSPHISGYSLLAYTSAGLLILAGLAICLARTAALGALVLAVFFIVTMAVLHLPPALAKPAVWGVWQAVAESVAMGMGAVLTSTLAPNVDREHAERATLIARLIFGLCLLVFGGSHFAYAKLTASLVPAWLPPSQMFWTYVTGVAQIAAGLALLSGVQAQRSAILLTAMYLVFGLLVHLPAVVARPSLDGWTENAINLLLIGAAWCMADVLARETRRIAGA